MKKPCLDPQSSCKHNYNTDRDNVVKGGYEWMHNLFLNKAQRWQVLSPIALPEPAYFYYVNIYNFFIRLQQNTLWF